MAIVLDTSFKGLEIKKAYFRVVRADVSKTDMNFTVEMCVNSESEGLSYSYYNCEYKIDGGNPMEQAYEHIKNIDEYHGFIDA